EATRAAEGPAVIHWPFLLYELAGARLYPFHIRLAFWQRFGLVA
ncbi:unnamed protein product, partial [marine sediment metagenome]